MTSEDAIAFIISSIQTGVNFKHQGSDVCIYPILDHYLRETEDGYSGPPQAHHWEQFVSVLYAALWELCRRGILRPSEPIPYGGEGHFKGIDRYMITPPGRDWIDRVEHLDYLPLQPGRLSEQLRGFETRFGQGYASRAQEAIRCYNGLCYYGCCAMCGAAFESIILALGIEKKGDEDYVLRTYRQARGRSQLENLLVGQPPSEQIKQDYRFYSDLLKYWRDEAAHGSHINITEEQAYLSLMQLYRFALWADNNWQLLTES